jgi:micrococcal nuclease
MLKKFFSFFLFTLLVLVLFGCEPKAVALPDLSGKSREEITETLTDLGLTAKYYFDVSVIYDEESDYDKFVKYGKDSQGVQYTVGQEVAPGTEIKIYTTPLSLSLHYLYTLSDTQQLKTADYTGREFIADGIGEVSVSRFVDGDTTMFTSGSQSFSVRYLGIDTPESTALYEPWGKAAAAYTTLKLGSAQKIVLEAEGERQDGNGRYLAWVWYLPQGADEFLLLNLELVELAYSKNKVSTGSVFTSILTAADWDASLTKRRVWGEIDPGYDYSKDGTQMTIEYLMNNFNDYIGLKVVATGIITKKIGTSVYIQDATGYGIYMYGGFTTSAQLQVGAYVSIGGLIPTFYSGSPQLSNFNKTNLSVLTEAFEVSPVVLTYSDFAFNRIGTLVTMESLTVTSINNAGTSVYVKDSANHEIVIRIDDSTGLTATALGISVGKVLNVTGPLGYYDFNYSNNPETYVYDRAKYQLMLCASEDIVIE